MWQLYASTIEIRRYYQTLLIFCGILPVYYMVLFQNNQIWLWCTSDHISICITLLASNTFAKPVPVIIEFFSIFFIPHYTCPSDHSKEASMSTIFFLQVADHCLFVLRLMCEGISCPIYVFLVIFYFCQVWCIIIFF